MLLILIMILVSGSIYSMDDRQKRDEQVISIGEFMRISALAADMPDWYNDGSGDRAAQKIHYYRTRHEKGLFISSKIGGWMQWYCQECKKIT